jgi:hypothetical protein
MVSSLRSFGLVAALAAFWAGPANAQVASPAPDHAEAFDWYEEIEEFADQVGLSLLPLTKCVDETEPEMRQRLVTRYAPLQVTVDDAMAVHVTYRGDDPDGEVQSCIDEALEEMELEEVPSEYAGFDCTFHSYTDNYYQRRRMRHGEIIALYTLSGVSAGIAVGSFVAARNDESELSSRLEGVAADSPSRRNITQRADRFRTAAWAMTGVSIASFVAGTLLYSANRDIEDRENPVLAFSPSAPGTQLGFSLSGQF